MFNVSQNMAKDEAKIYGFNNSEITTTMMQNSQWGAVAYLAQSEYGNMQKSNDGQSGIWNNSYNEGFTYDSNNSYKMDNRSVTLTGMSGSSRDNYTNYYSKVVDGSKKDNGDSIEITYTNINSNATTGSNYTNTFYRYYTENGQKASTTRNIYGIYDMSGGAWEYMANYLGSVTGNQFVSKFLTIESIRKDCFSIFHTSELLWYFGSKLILSKLLNSQRVAIVKSVSCRLNLFIISLN